MPSEAHKCRWQWTRHVRTWETGLEMRWSSISNSGKIPSINKSAAKFLLTRVAVDNGVSRFPLPDFPVLQLPIPAGYAISSLRSSLSHCAALCPVSHKLLTHAAGKKEALKQRQKSDWRNQIKLLNWIKIVSWKTENICAFNAIDGQQAAWSGQPIWRAPGAQLYASC